MTGHRRREHVLHIGIDGHLDHSAIERLVHFTQCLTRATVKHEKESSTFVVDFHDRVLPLQNVLMKSFSADKIAKQHNPGTQVGPIFTNREAHELGAVEKLQIS